MSDDLHSLCLSGGVAVAVGIGFVDLLRAFLVVPA